MTTEEKLDEQKKHLDQLKTDLKDAESELLGMGHLTREVGKDHDEPNPNRPEGTVSDPDFQPPRKE
jgi:hypothetical protein